MAKKHIATIYENNIQQFSCPICKNSMELIQSKSLVCLKNHTFDIAKQGYVNMLMRPVNSQYDKQLFQSRRKIITESNLYAPLHKKILEIIIENMDGKNVCKIFDAGCGEGSHLIMIKNLCENIKVTGIGLDISKEGIRMAARNDKESIWIVGDLANTPLKDKSCNMILNILSPANYKEFNRLLAPNGRMIKVVPRPNYLKELRVVLNQQKNPDTNEKIISLFKENFSTVEHTELNYSKEISQEELVHLVNMSPLTWNLNDSEKNQIMEQGVSEITIDLDILIGKND
mgnify:FL=1